MKNLYPKIIFKYSWIYDQIWKETPLDKKAKKYPSQRKILNFIKKVEKLWRRAEKKILQELSIITHLKWKSKFINCYVVGRCTPFSDPLTLPVYEKLPDYFVDVLTHELIHNLFTQNSKRMKKVLRYLRQKYPKETQKTRVHVLVHAIHSYIYYEFFDEKHLKRDTKSMNRYPDYKKSWQIVQKQGYKNIINEFVKRIKK